MNLPTAQTPPIDSRTRMAEFVRTVGRGPGRARALTREETREAFSIILDGGADPHQVGALLMLLRYRGEGIPEMAGLVEAIRAHAGLDPPAPTDIALDWPSYGSGKTRGAPWFLLAALALAANGHKVVMHGSNEFSGGIPVETALQALGRPVATGPAMAQDHLSSGNFTYLPLAAISPQADRLLSLRRVLGLRSPVNTAGRLLNPFNARASVDGVFHPPYIDLHRGTAAALDRSRLAVIKGAGGEAERNPAKPVTAHIWDRTDGMSEIALPAISTAAPLEETKRLGLDAFAAVWQGRLHDQGALATILGTLEFALLAIKRADDIDTTAALARDLWGNRHRG